MNNYTSPLNFAKHWKLQLPKPYDEWRFVPGCPFGQVHGIPRSAGFAVCTNGILVAIERGEDVFFGHMEFFIPDTQTRTGSIKPEKTPKAEKTPRAEKYVEYFA